MHISSSKVRAAAKWKKYFHNLSFAGLVLLASCQQGTGPQPGGGQPGGPQPEAAGQTTPPIQGTWQLVTGAIITGKDTAVTDYTKVQSMIKIIGKDHFAFLKHDLHPAKDSSNHFDAGGGPYTLAGDQYTEHLDYYSNPAFEHQTFTFTVHIDHDTLVQQGVEKNEKAHIEHYIIEKYARLH